MTYGYLIHHGVKGMKWGIRNYQNADGSLTAAGRQRYGVHERRIPREHLDMMSNFRINQKLSSERSNSLSRIRKDLHKEKGMTFKQKRESYKAAEKDIDKNLSNRFGQDAVTRNKNIRRGATAVAAGVAALATITVTASVVTEAAMLGASIIAANKTRGQQSVFNGTIPRSPLTRDFDEWHMKSWQF